MSVGSDSLSPVITGDLKSKIDQLWNTFWTGGIANPLEVIEQITYLMFIRRLDGDRRPCPGVAGSWSPAASGAPR